MKMYLIGLLFCAIAGGLAMYFGGIGGITAVVIAQIGITIVIKSEF